MTAVSDYRFNPAANKNNAFGQKVKIIILKTLKYKKKNALKLRYAPLDSRFNKTNRQVVICSFCLEGEIKRALYKA